MYRSISCSYPPAAPVVKMGAS
uniref:Uncharacterized protein n=1 Tax=Arundo donax TaxID=35708 RepID=A0A0A8YXU6_ARUDO